MVCSYYLLPDLSLPHSKPDISLEDAVRLTHESGISGMELQDYGSGFFDWPFPDAPPKKVLRGIKDVADSYRVKVPTISAMAGNLLAPDSDVQVDYIRKWLDLASEIGVKVLKINVGMKPKDLENDAAFERARACLKRLARHAQDYGIPLAPELWPPSYPTSDPAAMYTLLKNVDSQYLRFTADNYVLPSGWALEAYRLLAPYAVNAHVSRPRRGDLKGALKERFRFKDFIPILKEVGYDGYLMIEWRAANRPIPKLVESLRETRDMLEKIIASPA